MNSHPRREYDQTGTRLIRARRLQWFSESLQLRVLEDPAAMRRERADQTVDGHQAKLGVIFFDLQHALNEQQAEGFALVLTGLLEISRLWKASSLTWTMTLMVRS